MPELRRAERDFRGRNFSLSGAVDRIEKWSVGSLEEELLLLDNFSLSAYLV